MTVSTIGGIEYIHIQDFAALTGRSKQAIRRLIEDGNSVRRMKATRDRSRLMIPVMELVGYPFVNQGKQMNGTDIYHYCPTRPVPSYVGDKRVDDVETYVTVDEALKEEAEAYREGRDSNIYWDRCLCTECTFGKGCMARCVADTLEVPRGDP